MNMEKLKEYATLIVRKGLNVQNNQLVVITAPLEAKELVLEVARAAFDVHAKDVVVRWKEDRLERERILYANREVFETVPKYASMLMNETAKEGACYLSITGTDPDLMQDVDMSCLVEYLGKFRQATFAQRDRLDHMLTQWCVAACAIPGWAKKVYPTLSEDEAMEKLWDAIFDACRIQKGHTQENWDEHNASFERRVNLLNAFEIEWLHYKNGHGTDLIVRLPEGYRFAGGSSKLRDKEETVYFPNLPTEEIFSAPYKYGVDGRLAATMPLLYNGSLIDEFWFEFRTGKVVDYDAKVGKSVLESLLKSDEGASYLGEVALVPVDSPISKMHTLFYNTLFDENASCHFALGAAYLECVEGGMEMDKEQLEKAGLNDSNIHVDFMVGSEDLSIVAHLKNGQDIKVFEEGNWSSLF